MKYLALLFALSGCADVQRKPCTIAESIQLIERAGDQDKDVQQFTEEEIENENQCTFN